MSTRLADPGLRGDESLSQEEDGREKDSGNVPEESLPGTFYPLRDLLGELVKQENDLWEKTHGVQFAAVSGWILDVVNDSQEAGRVDRCNHMPCLDFLGLQKMKCPLMKLMRSYCLWEVA